MYAHSIFLADSIISQPDRKVNHWTTNSKSPFYKPIKRLIYSPATINDRNNGDAGATAFIASTRTGAIFSSPQQVGHNKPDTTLGIYTHVSESMQKELCEKLDRISV